MQTEYNSLNLKHGDTIYNVLLDTTFKVFGCCPAGVFGLYSDKQKPELLRWGTVNRLCSIYKKAA